MNAKVVNMVERLRLLSIPIVHLLLLVSVEASLSRLRESTSRFFAHSVSLRFARVLGFGNTGINRTSAIFPFITMET